MKIIKKKNKKSWLEGLSLLSKDTLSVTPPKPPLPPKLKVGDSVKKCKHKFIDAKDGTLDKICTICGKRAMQGALYFEPKVEINMKDIIDEDEIAKKIAKKLSERYQEV